MDWREPEVQEADGASQNGTSDAHQQPPDHNVVWDSRLTADRLLLSMQVPPDLASQLSSVAVLSGRSPEAFLRQAILQLIESTARTLVTFEETPQHGFVPQPQSFSVYE
jgi:hypothetical protein